MTHEPPELRELLSQGRWLRRLARELCSDPHVAEDLVQGTWVVALQHPPRTVASLRVWLGRVLANLSRERWRGEAARRVRERARAARDPAPSAADVVARAETGRRLVECVLALPEPFRATLLHRYFDELSAEEIARRAGVPGSTVRSRLARGLQMVRARLARSGEGSWLPAILALGDRDAVAHGAVTANGASTLVKSCGAILMTTMTKSILGLAALAVLGWMLWSIGGAGHVPSAASEPIRTDASGLEREPAAPEPESRTSASREVVSAPAPRDPDRILAGQVLESDARTPVPLAHVLVFAAGSDDDTVSSPPLAQITCDTLGRFRMGVGNRDVVAVRVDRAEGAGRRIPWLVVAEDIVVLMPRSAPLTVEVVAPTGGDGSALAPVAGVACRLVTRGDTARKRTIERGTTGLTGEVVLHVCQRDAHLVVDRRDGPCFSHIYTLAEGQDRLRVVLPPFERVEGRVLDERFGQPLARATVSKLFQPELSATSDADGKFTLPHAGEREIWVVASAGHARAFLDVPSRPDRSLEVRLEVAATLRGSLRGFADDVTVTATSAKTFFVYQRWSAAVGVERGGSVRIEGIPPGEEIVVEARDGAGRRGWARAAAVQPGTVGDFGVLAPQALATLRGTISGFEGGVPVIVQIQIRCGTVPVHEVTRVVRGREYSVAGLPPGAASVEARQGELASQARTVELVGGAQQTLDLDVGPAVRGVVLDATGAGVENVIVKITDEAGPVIECGGARTDEHGWFVSSVRYPATTKTVRVLDPEPDRCAVPEAVRGVRAGGPALHFELVRKSHAIRGRVDAALLRANGSARLYVSGRDAGGEAVSAGVNDDGTFTLMVRGGGPYELRLSVLEDGGSELGIREVPGVDPLRAVSPGGEAVCFRQRT